MNYGYIYYLKNEINGMMYIGKITTQTLYYKKNSYKGSGIEIAQAIKEYGSANFSIHYIAAAKSSEELTFLEKYYLIYYKIPNEKFYNINLATSSSEQSTYYNKNNLNGTNLKNIICYNIDDNSQIVFNNITQFCKDYNLSRGCIFNVISGQRLTHKNRIFWYEDYPISQDALNWILNYKKKTSYKTKYFNIEEVKTELKRCYELENNKICSFEFSGYYIEDGKEIEIDWDEINLEHQFLNKREGNSPKQQMKIEDLKLNTEKDDKFEQKRETDYALTNNTLTLYFNYNEINILTKIYPDINSRLLRQAINRKQKTVMSGKYSLVYFGVCNK